MFYRTVIRIDPPIKKFDGHLKFVAHWTTEKKDINDYLIACEDYHAKYGRKVWDLLVL